MALPVRLERTTLWLTVRCSNQLSYGSMVTAFALPRTKHKIVLWCIVPCIFYFQIPLGESARVELANAGVKVPCLTAWLRLYCYFLIFWIMRIGFAFSNLVAPIHCQQEEERHPVICCTNGTAASYENLYGGPHNIAQYEPNKKYHIHMPSTDLIFGWKDLHGRYHTKQNTYEPKKISPQKKAELVFCELKIAENNGNGTAILYYEVAVFPHQQYSW